MSCQVLYQVPERAAPSGALLSFYVILPHMRLLTLLALLTSSTLAASDAYPPPRFADPDRVRKLEAALPEIDQLFRAYATGKRIPAWSGAW